MHDGRPLVSALLHSRMLLNKANNGSRILVQYYIYAITRVIVGNATIEPSFVAKSVREACFQILNAIFAFPKYLNDSSFKLKLTYKERQMVHSTYYTGNMSSGAKWGCLLIYIILIDRYRYI